MMKLKQYGIQTLVRVVVWKPLMEYYAALVSRQLRSKALIVRGLGDMWCLELERRRESRKGVVSQR